MLRLSSVISLLQWLPLSCIHYILIMQRRFDRVKRSPLIKLPQFLDIIILTLNHVQFVRKRLVRACILGGTVADVSQQNLVKWLAVHYNMVHVIIIIDLCDPVEPPLHVHMLTLGANL